MKYSAVKKYILQKLERELAPEFTYHSVHHTLDVLKVTIDLCKKENISQKNTTLLKTAALFHDSGFTKSRINHEEVGCDIARQTLPDYTYSAQEIEMICGMIMATKIPQSPKNNLEQILADADLDYLGRADFKTIGDTLFEELKFFKVLETEKEWNNLQVKFLEGHSYFTDTNIKEKTAQKKIHLQQLKNLIQED